MSEHIPVIKVEDSPADIAKSIDTSEDAKTIRGLIEEIRSLRTQVGLTTADVISLKISSDKDNLDLVDKFQDQIQRECVAARIYSGGDPGGGKAIISNGKTFVVHVIKEKSKPEDYLKRMVPPHHKVSREVTNEDMQRLLEEAAILLNLCYIPQGDKRGAVGMSHPQIDDKDPMRFFVTAEMELIINPVVTRTSKTTVDSEEGCMSFPFNPVKIVQRYNKMDVKFQVLNIDPKDPTKLVLSEPQETKVSGKMAKIFAHEIAHLNGHYVYDDVISADDCLR